jgi:hypothetical protein
MLQATVRARDGVTFLVAPKSDWSPYFEVTDPWGLTLMEVRLPASEKATCQLNVFVHPMYAEDIVSYLLDRATAIYRDADGKLVQEWPMVEPHVAYRYALQCAPVITRCDLYRLGVEVHAAQPFTSFVRADGMWVIRS